MLMNLLFGGAAALFLAMSLAALLQLRWARRLPALVERPGVPDATPIRCSVIVPARNEEDRIEKTIRHLLNQGRVSIEVIGVDDRSSDRTGEILARLAAEDSRVRVTRVERLPEGWLGKCHACHAGARVATGDWLLFTDADCWMKPDVIARALSVAVRDGVEHIALTPGVAALTIPAQGWHLAFLISLAGWFAGVNQDKPKSYFGMGAFNLVQRTIYDRWGGHEALRLTVLDDVRLGLLVRRAGGRTRAFIGGDDVECHWGHTAREMVKIMEKNYFAALDFRTWTAIMASMAWLAIVGLVVIGPFTGTWAGAGATAASLTLAIPAYVLSRRIGWGIRAALMTPFVFPLLFYAIMRSVVLTLRQRGVRWRDTFYSLDQLRAHGVK
jgi:hypothetical protein